MVKVIDFGIGKYEEILNSQRELFGSLVKDKKEGREGEEFILIGEHFPVITLGRRAHESNVLIPQNILNERGIELYKIERGGDVTYHGPGQLIVYPILDLEKHRFGVKDYVNLLEETVIKLLQNYGIKGERVDGATGVWIDKGSKKERKICAIGIKCSRFCTMHGLALNVNPDLTGFSLINPCGFVDKGVTSLQKETGNFASENAMSIIKKDFLHIFLSLIFPFEEILYLSK